MRALGIDPGTAITGFALVREERDVYTLEACGVITTAAGEPMPRLQVSPVVGAGRPLADILHPPVGRLPVGAWRPEGDRGSTQDSVRRTPAMVS